jgi:hypothetical protein
LLHAHLTATAAGLFIREPQGPSELENEFLALGGSKETYDEAWRFLTKYQAVLEDATYQVVLIAFNSHWDWYLRNLRGFVLAAR